MKVNAVKWWEVKRAYSEVSVWKAHQPHICLETCWWSFHRNPGIKLWRVWMQGRAFGSRGGKTGFFFHFVSQDYCTYNFLSKPFNHMFSFFPVEYNAIKPSEDVSISIPSLFQATRCSFSGKLASDPDSTVYISGCEGKESMDISLMSKKVDTSSLSLPPT